MTVVSIWGFFTGRLITIGDNVVLNRRCYLDGRAGIQIQDNVTTSPEVNIISLDHVPDSQFFETRSRKVVVYSNVWI